MWKFRCVNMRGWVCFITEISVFTTFPVTGTNSSHKRVRHMVDENKRRTRRWRTLISTKSSCSGLWSFWFTGWLWHTFRIREDQNKETCKRCEGYGNDWQKRMNWKRQRNQVELLDSCNSRTRSGSWKKWVILIMRSFPVLSYMKRPYNTEKKTSRMQYQIHDSTL